jgi:hypothetical protein
MDSLRCPKLDELDTEEITNINQQPMTLVVGGTKQKPHDFSRGIVAR